MAPHPNVRPDRSWEDAILGSRVVRRLLPGLPLDWEDRQTASAFLPLAAMVLAAALLYLIVGGLLMGAAPDYLAASAVIASTLGSLLAIRRRRLLVAVWLFVAGTAAASTLVLFTAGLAAASLGDALVVIVIAAILLGWRGAVLFGVFFAVVITGVQVAQLRRWLVPGDPPPPATIWLSIALPVALITGLLAVSTHWLRGVVGQLRRRERQLKATNDALTESREALSLVIAESPDAIIATGDRGVIQLVNDAAERLLGYGANELLGRPFLELGLVAPDSQARSTAEIGRVLAGMEGPPTELEIVRKDGSRVPVEVNGRMVKRGDGSMQVQAVIRNIEDRKQAERSRQELEAELRHAQRLESVGRLAGGIAHDFNNLLTVILSTASSLKSRIEAPDLQEDTEAIEAAAERAAELTRQLLAFSRKQILRPEVIDPGLVIAGVETILRRLIPERIEIVVRRGPFSGPVAIKADPQQIQQVVINLALNARDAMPGAGILGIGLDEIAISEADREGVGELGAGPHVRFSVSDTGVGMDEHTRTHLFEPFFTTKPVGQGTGLGLATVHGIVSQSGGHIRVHSREGQGTTFEILMPVVEPLPVAANDGTPRPVRAPIDRDAGAGSATILLVEDEPLVRQTTARILRGLGYDVMEAGNANEALKLALGRGRPVDLLLTDVIMPGASGPDLAARLRAHAHLPARVLFMSGHADVPLHEAELLERSPFLPKPFSPLDLARKVREVLDQETALDAPAAAAPAPPPRGSTA